MTAYIYFFLSAFTAFQTDILAKEISAFYQMLMAIRQQAQWNMGSGPSRYTLGVLSILFGSI